RTRAVFGRLPDTPVRPRPGNSAHAPLGFAEATGVVRGPQHYKISQQPILGRALTPHERLQLSCDGYTFLLLGAHDVRIPDGVERAHALRQTTHLRAQLGSPLVDCEHLFRREPVTLGKG